MSDFTELDKRFSMHEVQCKERYDAILSSIEVVKSELSKINTRALSAMTWLVLTLFGICGTLVALIFTKIIGV